MFNYNKEFYPTPEKIAYKMLSYIDFRTKTVILESSAGKGDIADIIASKIRINQYCKDNREKQFIDCVELDPNLRHILKGKNYKVVHDDFLTFNTYKKYTHIVMNPPFSNGDKHLLKAIEIQERAGGAVICLLNAETLLNPYSNSRKILLEKLNKYNATVEYIKDAFIYSERKTDVNTALIYIDIPATNTESDILKNLKKENPHIKNEESFNSNLIEADYINGIVSQYNLECQAGLKLINEYKAMKKIMINTFSKDSYSNNILNLELSNDKNRDIENGFIEDVRLKYWKALFNSNKFSKIFTDKSRYEYFSKIESLKDYDFSIYNITQMQLDIVNSMKQTIEDTILEMFDEFSSRHHYSEYSKNIHLYNGWKTNKAWKINKKVIIPLNAFDSFYNSFRADYRVVNKLSDIEKIFSYFDAISFDDKSLSETLAMAEEKGITKNINLKYFKVTFYKKGTCHIEFKDLELLKQFNLFASQKKNWLPPSYGHKKYEEFNEEEKAIVDDFEGKESYAKNFKNNLIAGFSNLLMIS